MWKLLTGKISGSTGSNVPQPRVQITFDQAENSRELPCFIELFGADERSFP